MKPKTTGATLFLIKDGLKSKDVVKTGAVKYVVRLSDQRTGRLYIRKSIPVRPGWLKIFKGRVTLPSHLWNQHSAAVLLVRSRRRLYAVVFGYGRTLLRPGSWESDFGLKVTLNSIGSDGLRSVERLRFDAINSHTLSQTSRHGSAEQFGIEPERELLRAVAGVPVDKQLGSTIAGAESLRSRIPLDLGMLPKHLDGFRTRFESKAYEQRFPWVGQISEVNDPTISAVLDDQLSDALRRQQLTNLYLAIPHIIDWNRTEGFRYSEKGSTHSDIDIRDFLQRERKPGEVDARTLRVRQVYQVVEGSSVPADSWSVYRSINFETRFRGATYLLTSGSWVEVNADFVKEIQDRVQKVRTSSLILPPYSDRTETAYNKRIAQESGGKLALMDQQLISRGGGHSRIEFCDLYERNARVIHVKRWGGASTLSHLFAQGEVSGRLFLQDAEFRSRLNAKLPATHKLVTPEQQPTSSDFEVLFAIVSKSTKSLYQSLPFFGKLDLLAARDRLALYGYKVRIAKIDVA